MSPQDQNRRELAKQGDPKAIADAINHSLKPKGISADVMRDNGCLHVMMEGDQVPNNQQALVNFVRNGIERLGIDTIYTIKVYGRQFGDDLPVWEQEIVLRTPPIKTPLPSEEEPPIASTPLPVEDEEDDDYDIDDEIIDNNYNNLDDDDYISDEDDEEPEAHPVYNPEEDDDPDDEPAEETRQVEPEQAKNKLLLFGLLGLLALLAALAALHFTGVFRLPFLPGGSQETEPTTSEAPASPGAAPTNAPASPAPASPPAPVADPFSEAVKAATNAANLAQTAQTKADWTKVASEWQRASELMAKVPANHPKVAVAKDRAGQYAKNQQVAQQRAAAVN